LFNKLLSTIEFLIGLFLFGSLSFSIFLIFLFDVFLEMGLLSILSFLFFDLLLSFKLLFDVLLSKFLLFLFFSSSLFFLLIFFLFFS
jgi:hypothetical protein